MERKGKFTRGPVGVYVEDGGNLGEFVWVADVNAPELDDNPVCLLHGDSEQRKADSSLIASAFNAATACEDMGYDGEACVNALPELVEALTECIGPELSGESNEFCKGYDTVAIRMTWGELRRARAILAKCRG